MRFSESREQLEFAASLGDLLAKADTPATVRAWAAGDYGRGRALWGRLADQGVLALGLPERYGGYGATPVDLVLAFEQLGRAAVPGPLVESIAVLPRLLAGTSAAPRLEKVGTGQLMATVAMPPRVPYALDGAAADELYVVAGTAVSRAAAAAPVASVDPARRLTAVTAGESLGRVDPNDAFDLGALCTAAQVLGAGQALLERSSEYALQRSQFGKPIGSFQAVKHLLADVMVALDLARPLLFGAALAIGTPTQARDVSAAKVACSDAAYLASRNGLQVHGAIGYTQEYDLSLWLTKVRALYSAWGTQAEHRARVLHALVGT
ncbi:acyl-CoA dehydrogenase family protein [Jatrophihabitans sp.]|uniref:acyl-CoA dehydrogenase family protein n=1 Tax=Jatrophihabitans sp. TaxID=1932789 RepID=UPI0030C71150|nr:acyl-CoA dehydrogenase protein [Jatrophihabitans sp.]